MRVGERVAPAFAAISAIGTFACCLPLGSAALLGLGSILGALSQYQPWLLTASVVLLAIGVAQMWRTRRVCHRTSPLSVVILALSAAIVFLVVLFPQMIAGLLTDWLS